VVVLDLSASYGIGLPSRDELAELRKELERRNVELWYTHVRRRDSEHALPEDLTAGVRIFDDPEQAVLAFRTSGRVPSADRG
jgi:hypothetical protein